ncbi:MAG: hypothetical protein HOP17_09795 [Acidobacteria bacterium]|nr:hypothetical protein [Acidobacteriota bacterium]
MTTSYMSEHIPDPDALREKRFFQIAFFLPLILPLIPLVGLPAVLDFQVNGAMAVIAFFLIASLILGGVPYLFFLIGVFTWMRGKDGQQVRQMTYIAPIIYAGVLIVCCTLVGVVGGIFQREPSALAGGIVSGMFLSIFGLVTGYAYVAFWNLAFVGYRWLVQERLN